MGYISDCKINIFFGYMQIFLGKTTKKLDVISTASSKNKLLKN